MRIRPHTLKIGGGIVLTLGVLLFVRSQSSPAQQMFRFRPQMPGKPIILPLDNGAVYLNPMAGQGGGGFGGGGDWGGGAGQGGGGFGGGGQKGFGFNGGYGI